MAVNGIVQYTNGGFLPDILLFTQAPILVVWFDGTIIAISTILLTNVLLRFMFLKKNQNTPRPSEHPPVVGGKMSKRLGGIKRLQIQKKALHGI